VLPEGDTVCETVCVPLVVGDCVPLSVRVDETVCVPEFVMVPELVCVRDGEDELLGDPDTEPVEEPVPEPLCVMDGDPLAETD
jgi:hypothetical protein